VSEFAGRIGNRHEHLRRSREAYGGCDACSKNNLEWAVKKGRGPLEAEDKGVA